MDSALHCHSLTVFSQEEGSVNEDNTESSNPAKRHSKTRSKVWEKVAWFTRKTRTSKESKTDSPRETRRKSPLKRTQRNKTDCLATSVSVYINSSPSTASPNLTKTKSKSGLRKARSFHYLKRKKLVHSGVEAECKTQGASKENDAPTPTATGTFYDFESTGRRSSRVVSSTSCCSLLNEMADREVNSEQGEQGKKSIKSSLSLPMSLLSIGDIESNEVHDVRQIESNCKMSRERMGPLYHSWPRKKRNFHANQYSEVFSPPQKQKRMCNLRRTATFSGFDACKLSASANEENGFNYHLKGIKSTPLLELEPNQIKNQNGLTIGVIHSFKSSTNFTPSVNDTLPDSSGTGLPLGEEASDDRSHINFKDDANELCIYPQACSNVCEFLEMKGKWEQEDAFSPDMAGYSDVPLAHSFVPIDDIKHDIEKSKTACNLNYDDSGSHLVNSTQRDDCPEFVQDMISNINFGEIHKLKSWDNIEERKANVPSCKPCGTERLVCRHLEMISEIPDCLSEIEGDNKCPQSNEMSRDFYLQTKIESAEVESEHHISKNESIDAGVYCIKIEDQATDFSENKEDHQSNPISMFSETDEKVVNESSISQNTTIKDVDDKSLIPLNIHTVDESPELKDFALNDSSTLSTERLTNQEKQEDVVDQCDTSLEITPSDERSQSSSSSQLDFTDNNCHGIDSTSMQLSSQSLLKEQQVKIDGPLFKHETETMLEWFSEFDDEQKNILIRRLLEHCELPQMHMLSVVMEPVLHKTCPSNCQDMLAWLPQPVTETVLLYLDPVSLCQCSQVDRFWNSLTNSPLIWKALCRRNEWQLTRNAGKIQCTKYTLPCGTVQWKKMFVERFLLRRNWLNGRCKVRTFEGHTQGISCVQFDMTRIVSGSSDKTIRVWDLSRDDSHAVLTLAGHSGTVRCLNLNGNRLVSGSVDRSIKIWDLSFESYWSGASCKVTMVGHMHTVRCLQVDDHKVVSGSYDKTLKVWDIKTGHCKLTLRGHNAAVLCVQFDDSKIVSGSYDNTIKVWSLEEGECLMTLTGHHDAVTCLNLTQDGRKVISGSLDHNLKFWDLATGKCIGTLDWIRSEGHTGVVRCLQSDSWRIVSAGDDKTLKMWSLETGQRLLTLRCHTDGVTCLQFNDYSIVSGSYDQTVKVWNFAPEHEFLNSP